MGITLSEHVILLLYAFVLGVMLAAVYDLLRILRTYLGNGRALVFVFDLVFWIAAAFATFWFFLIFNDGKIRLPVMLVGLLGAGLYYVTIGRIVIKKVRESDERVKRNVHKAFIKVKEPTVRVSKAAGKEIFQKTHTAGVLFKKDCKDFKIRFTHCGKMMYNLLQSAKKAKPQKKDV